MLLVITLVCIVQWGCIVCNPSIVVTCKVDIREQTDHSIHKWWITHYS